jgi:two-component system, chemotaxis family, chemotaxis protein CheY
MTGAAASQTMRDLSSLRVLLVDDNRHMLTLMHRVLAAMRIKIVHEMADATEAFKDLKHLAPDLVFVDWVMEPLDGHEFVRMVRTSPESPCPNVPIIMVTGHTEEFRIKAAVAAGVNGFLAKPISPQMVYQRICNVLDDPRPLNQRQGRPESDQAAQA